MVKRINQSLPWKHFTYHSWNVCLAANLSLISTSTWHGVCLIYICLSGHHILFYLCGISQIGCICAHRHNSSRKNVKKQRSGDKVLHWNNSLNISEPWKNYKGNNSSRARGPRRSRLLNLPVSLAHVAPPNGGLLIPLIFPCATRRFDTEQNMKALTPFGRREGG